MKTLPSATAGEESDDSSGEPYFQSKFGLCGAEPSENLVFRRSCPNIGHESFAAGGSESCKASAPITGVVGPESEAALTREPSPLPSKLTGSTNNAPSKTGRNVQVVALILFKPISASSMTREAGYV